MEISKDSSGQVFVPVFTVNEFILDIALFVHDYL